MPGLEGVDQYPGHLEAQISLHLIFSCGVTLRTLCVLPTRQDHISHWNCNTRNDSENLAGDEFRLDVSRASNGAYIEMY